MTAIRDIHKKLAAGLLVAAATVAVGSSPLRAADAPAAKPAPAAAADAYRKEIETWRKDRLAGLTKEDGWLSLVGLYWLQPGENSLGSDPGSRVVLPKGKAPERAGILVREGEKVTLRPEAGVALTADGQAVTGPIELKSDVTGKPTVLKLGSLTFFAIQRGDRVGVRIKDREAESRTAFKGLDDYPVNPDWRVVARFEPYDPPKQVPISNVLGQVEDNPSPGAVVFDWQGKTYRLDALGDLKDGLSLIFGDATNGKGTYGAGRFLDTDPPKDGKVVVDFNQAYNPPCAFTAFATCPLPPPQNKLPIAVEAGEKAYAGGPHH